MKLQTTGNSLYNIPPGTKGFIKHNTQEKCYLKATLFYGSWTRDFINEHYMYEKSQHRMKINPIIPLIFQLHYGSINDLKNK